MDEVESKKSKDRSPNFPFINLQQALARAEQFYDQERRGAAPIGRAALHWRYSPASSGLIQTVAALKNYGLLVDEGSGSQRKVRLTDLALRILLDKRQGSEERLEFLRKAALSPSIAMDVQERWPEQLPSEATLNHYLVLDRNFSPSTAGKVAEILKANQELTNYRTGQFLSEDKPMGGDRNYPLVTSPDAQRGSNDGRFVGHVAKPGAGNLFVAGQPQVSNVALATMSSQELLQSMVDSLERSPVDATGVSTKETFARLAKEFQMNTPMDAKPAPEQVEQIVGPDGVVVRIEFSGGRPSASTYDFIRDYIDLRVRSLRSAASQATPRTPAVDAEE